MVTEILRERPTVRVLLLDESDRILLMKGRLPSRPEGPGAWFPVGGGIEAGETVLEAAAREIREETGLASFELGPLIGLREGVMMLAGDERVLMKESYLVARCLGADPVRDGWDATERTFIDDIRWWTLADLAATEDRVFPPSLPELMAEALAGRFPETPIVISWR